MYQQSGYADLLNSTLINTDSLIIGNLNLPNLDPNSVTYIDGSNDLADIILTNGQVLIGSTGAAPVGHTLTGTANEVIVTNGPGSITLSTPQRYCNNFISNICKYYNKWKCFGIG